MNLTDEQEFRMMTLEDLDPEPKVVAFDDVIGGPTIEYKNGSLASVSRHGGMVSPSHSTVDRIRLRRGLPV